MTAAEAVATVTVVCVGALVPVVVLWGCWLLGAHWLRSVMDEGV